MSKSLKLVSDFIDSTPVDPATVLHLLPTHLFEEHIYSHLKESDLKVLWDDAELTTRARHLYAGKELGYVQSCLEAQTLDGAHIFEEFEIPLDQIIAIAVV